MIYYKNILIFSLVLFSLSIIAQDTTQDSWEDNSTNTQTTTTNKVGIGVTNPTHQKTCFSLIVKFLVTIYSYVIQHKYL